MSFLKDNTFFAISHITVRYLDKILLPDLSFTMLRGEHWAITGNSGSGKTSVLQAILGKYNIVNGRIYYPFLEFFKNKNHINNPFLTPRQLISFVPQEARFKSKQNLADFYYQQRFNSLDAEAAVTVNEYLQDAFLSTDEQVLSAEIRFSMQWIIDNLDLRYLLNKTIIQLSHGETRRLLIAQALLKQPLLLLLDNPFIGLDTASRYFFHQLASRIIEQGTHIILVTSPNEMPDCITHVLELKGGKVSGQWNKKDYLLKGNNNLSVRPRKPDVNKLKNILKRSFSENDFFEDAINMQHIHVKYGKTTILDDISWRIKKGEKWALLGPNGAGKSTLLSLISGDNPQAYANTIYLFDQKRGSGESIWDIKHKIGFVSPELHIYFHTASNCLDVVLSGYTDTMHVNYKRISEAQISVAYSWMEFLEMDDLKDQKFKEQPAGKQRLILLVRALVKNPPLLILDEPCQGLDEEQKAHFKNVLEQVFNLPDKSMIYVTHYEEEIPAIVHHILHVEKGKVTEMR